MNKKITLSILALLFVVGAIFFFSSSTENAYGPRVEKVSSISGYAEYLQMVRSNEITGTVSDKDVANVVSQINKVNATKNKSEWPLKWSFSGPDNIGGRTRCLVIDKDDANIMYTGGVAGSVFKSNNKGASWSPITLGDDNFGVVSMAQTSDGNIFYGTGEGAFVGVNGFEDFSTGFNGSGIYISEDGETFSSLPTSKTFGYISVLAAHPSQNLLFAGTQAGLRFTDDKGATWKTLRAGSCRDIAFNKNGEVIVYIGNAFYKSSDPTNAASYSLISGIGSNSRGAAAWSNEDPNYLYIVTVGNISSDLVPAGSNNAGLNGFYRSTDGGASFVEEVNESSRFFAPFANLGNNTQGNYDMAIAVHPGNKNRVFIGGVGFAEWTEAEGPKMVGNTFDSPTNPFGIHADKHLVKFDVSGEDTTMYVCTDGGIYKTTNEALSRYASINIGLSSTQFYGIAAARNGRVLGGTQDNSTILLTREAYPRKNGFEVIGGDGFKAEISQYNPDIMFGESYYGDIRRSLAGGVDMSSFWDNRISEAFASSSQPNTIFNTAIELWEDPEIVDLVKTNGPDSKYDSQIKSRLFLTMNDGIYMCNNVLGALHNPDKPSNDNIRWFKVSNATGAINLSSSRDGNSLFIASRGNMRRIDGLNKAVFDTTELTSYKTISDSLSTVSIKGNLSIGSRAITSIAIDKNDPNRVVITVGNYNNTNYVYQTTNALEASPSWSSIQGNLPRFPVYHAIINESNSDEIILGTEFGIWATQNGTASSPSWSEALEGIDANMPMPRVPVFEVAQVSDKPWSGPKIYAGTHGMGIWETSSLLTNVKRTNNSNISNVIAYPNPANNYVNLKTDIKGLFKLTVYSLKGDAVYTSNGNSNGTINISTSNLINGNYFVEVLGDNMKAVSKIIIQH